ncbi:hypothetical protein A3K24_01955 [candidate division Kazan bacterium RIFCSPHIGHO2_01_FULL_44_14]|uniref:YoaR-like putative peptidoglycan binding domain-containing protein n=1 Tax=candidate division Kazan bacterium RIFCSPLOWO2_01_FULL_45_19 TaxID=1798538 RepID=A0A1F4NQA9_UNCK3|nr:hypothetical protein [uncultured bacterium]OGB73590.1 MAG: hypothetical protein A3K51_01955 [candidate division Kazan bacterium RIFCSPLOWO2_01_FULL_45_19]OGB77835.1 MAG: hypothetical protein A3K24_01955 [candidate division Kazan bacterium RIFCSPHIGHO2_01_FULL_44_14]
MDSHPSKLTSHQIRLLQFMSLGVGGLLIVAVGAYFGVDVIYARRVLPGVQFLEIDLGGRTRSQAVQLISKRVDGLPLGNIRLEFEGQSWEMDPNQFGFELDGSKLADEAILVGRRGQFAQRLSERSFALVGTHQPIVSETDLVHSFNRPKLNQYLSEIGSRIVKPQRDAKLTIKNNRATEFMADQAGQTLDMNKTVELIARNLLNPAPIVLPITTRPATVTLAETNTLGINTLIARGVSNFTGSPRNRRHNIATGAAKFDGIIIAPKSIFSFIRALGAVDGSTGYLPELVIKGDKTEPEFGGGLCQVSTTAFRAILNGGLPVVERRNHSYRVAYYEPPGTDATIYQPYPDLKFTNDTPGSILMDTYIVGNELHFDFYGTDTGRTIEMTGPYVSNITDYPEPIYIDTSTMPVGGIKQVEIAHRGADVVLYRKVYQNSQLLYNDTFKSHYIPWPAKYLRGVEEANKVEADLNNVLPTEAGQEQTNLPIE